MSITSDWHIHTRNSCDCPNGISMEKLVKQAGEQGITDFGITDHAHTFFNYPREIAASRKDYDELIAKQPELKGRFHFGVEVSGMSEWEVDMIENNRVKEDEVPNKTFTYGLRWSDGPKYSKPMFCINEDIKKKYGIEFVVGGVHWAIYPDDNPKDTIESLHKQYLMAIENPHIDIMAHWLWWWEGHPCENQFNDFDKVPQYMKDEIAGALKTYNKVFELNPGFAMGGNGNPDKGKFYHKYFEYAAMLQDMGITLAISTDNHAADYKIPLDYYDKVLREHGVDTNKNIFCLERK